MPLPSIFFISAPPLPFLSCCDSISLCVLSHSISLSSLVCLHLSISYCLSLDHQSSARLFLSSSFYPSISLLVNASLLISRSPHINMAFPFSYLQWCRQLSPVAGSPWRDRGSSLRTSEWRWLQRRYQSVESKDSEFHATQYFQDGCCGCVTHLIWCPQPSSNNADKAGEPCWWVWSWN